MDVSGLIERKALLAILGISGKALWRAIGRGDFPKAIKEIGRKQYWNRDVRTWGVKVK